MTERVGPRFSRYFGLDVWSGTHQMWPHSSHSKYLASRSIVMVSSKTFRLSQSGQGGALGEKVGSSGDTVERLVYRKTQLAVCRKPDPSPLLRRKAIVCAGPLESAELGADDPIPGQ